MTKKITYFVKITHKNSDKANDIYSFKCMKEVSKFVSTLDIHEVNYELIHR